MVCESDEDVRKMRLRYAPGCVPGIPMSRWQDPVTRSPSRPMLPSEYMVSLRRAGPSDAQKIGAAFDAAIREAWAGLWVFQDSQVPTP